MKHDIREPDKTKTHTYTFDKDEIQNILCSYIEKSRGNLPDGDIHLSGLEYRSQRKEELTLHIDEPIEDKK